MQDSRQGAPGALPLYARARRSDGPKVGLLENASSGKDEKRPQRDETATMKSGLLGSDASMVGDFDALAPSRGGEIPINSMETRP
jgi:hypothetical protein